MSGQRISIVIATFNLGHVLPETLRTVFSQTHAEREIIVVDDGSSDDTADRLGPYLSQIRFVRQENAGLAAARNHALRLAGGDYIAFLDADDVWTRAKLEIQLTIARMAPQCGLIACDGVQFEGDLSRRGDAKVVRSNLLAPHYLELLRHAPNGVFVGMVHKDVIIGPPIGCPAQTLIPRAVIDWVGPLHDGPIQDYEYYLRISQRYPMAFHHHSLVGWRLRHDSISGPPEGRLVREKQRLIRALRAHATRCEDEADRELVAKAIERHEAIIRDVIRIRGAETAVD